MASKWQRTDGLDERGNRVILIHEKAPERPYTPLHIRLSLGCMKIFMGLGIFLLIVSKLAGFI